MTVRAAPPTALHLAAVAVLSAGMLAFEVLLLRLFEFSHWHHFAGFAVSLALLGLGAAGTVLALNGERALRLGDGWFLAGMALMGGGLLALTWLQSRVALRPLFAVWDMAELARVLALDLVALVPFLGAGLAIGQAFLRWPEYPGRVYSANLLGSAAGSVCASLLLVITQVESALCIVVLAVLAAGLATALAQRQRLMACCFLVLMVPATVAQLHTPQAAVSDFKALSRLTELPDARALAVEPGLPGRLTVIRSDSLRFAPGLSLAWTQSVPAMDAAVLGSDRVVPLARRYGAEPDHLQASLGGLPFRLRPEGRVLVLGASRWATPAYLSNREMTWVERDGRILDQAARRGATARLVHGDPFLFLTQPGTDYRVIVLDGAFAEGDAATEDYLMTTSGLAQALSRLGDDGLLAVPLALDYPPRHGPRALATLVAALKQYGAADPGRHVAALRGMQELLLLASPEPLRAADLLEARAFSARWRFDLVWLPEMRFAEANRFHVLEEPVFYQAARAVFQEQAMPAAADWFETAPATLSSPYFWRAMRWDRVPALVDQLGLRAMSHLDWTLILAAVAALTVALLGFVLILLPLGRLPTIRYPLGRLSVAGYFTTLGLGYMLLELAVFQRAILYIGEPVLAASLVFAVFLGGSGIGSAMALTERSRVAVAGVYLPAAVGLAVAAVGFWLPVTAWADAGLPGRLMLVAGLSLPLAWALGRPFPWGLARLARQPRWVPWAWGINGLASVVGASAAPLLSVHFSQPATLGTGIACYLAAAAIALVWVGRRS